MIDLAIRWLAPVGDFHALGDVVVHYPQELIERLTNMGGIGRKRVLEGCFVDTETAKLVQYIDASVLQGVPV